MPNPRIQPHLERWYSSWYDAAQQLIDNAVSSPLDGAQIERYGHALARYADLIKAGGDAAGAARDAGLEYSLN